MDRRTANEEGITGEDGLVVAVLHEPADAVLGVARRVEGLDGDTANVEGGSVGGRLGHALALLASDDGKLCEAELSKLGGCCQPIFLTTPGGTSRDTGIMDEPASYFRQRDPSD